MPTRYLLIVATFVLSMLLYVDRVCISAAEDSIRADLNFDKRQIGWIFAAFSLGYALFQTPSGALADRYGPRWVLTAAVCCWSLLTALTAAARQLGAMLAVRFLFGIGEAAAFPGVARAVFSWVPMGERGLTQAINFSAARLGAALALPGVAWMVREIGWQNSFVVLGLVGFIWAAFWYVWFRDDPAAHPGIAADELQYIQEHRQQTSSERSSPLRVRHLLGSKNLWLLMAQYFASNFTFFFCLSWLPSYLKNQHSLSSMILAGWYATPVFFAGMAGNWVGGTVVDRLYRAGRWQLSRRLPATVGFLLAASGMAASSAVDDASSVVICLAVAVFGSDLTLASSWSVCVDIGRSHAGAVSGTMNMAGNLGSFVTALAFPYLEQWTGSTVPFFLVGAGLNLAAVAAWQFVRADRALEEF